MKNSTYSVRSHAVSTVKKSHAYIPLMGRPSIAALIGAGIYALFTD